MYFVWGQGFSGVFDEVKDVYFDSLVVLSVKKTYNVYIKITNTIPKPITV